MMILYRLRFSDGSHGAWTMDKARIEENYKFFFPLAKIETMEID